MYTSKFYKCCPVWGQNLLCTLYGGVKQFIRDGAFSRDLETKLLKLERDEKACQSYANNCLDNSLKNAIKNVPFYRGNKAHLANFNIIDKVNVKEQHTDFINRNYSGMRVKGATSGTNGAPLVIWQSKESVMRERAFANRHRHWAGYRKGDKRAWIRGDMIVPFDQKKGPFWRYSYFEKMLLLSSYHMKPNNLDEYLKAMHEYGTQIIQAYPSSIVTLAKHLEASNSFYPGKLKSIITSSESLTRESKLLIEERFKCTVFDWYGLFERVAAIGSCEYGNYHILTDYSCVELIPAGETEDGKKRAEIVGTNYNNALFPLIRYQTGDHVILTDKTKCACGRIFPIVEGIEGRVGDYLVAENNQRIHILNHIPKGVAGLIACQFYQHKKGAVHILVMADTAVFNEKERNILVENTKERLGQSIAVTVEVVDSIQRTKNGKMRQAICKIKDKDEEKD